jgi:[acyl-carrier-protein] S-malonyltransferase
MKAYLFPGQGSQFPGMAKTHFNQSPIAQNIMLQANEILGFSLTDIMFDGSEEDLKQTKVTQPAIFLHSVVVARLLGESFKPDMVAGHSLGEFSALVANQVLTFEDALVLVSKRALAMQKACELKPSSMAAIIGMEDEMVERICKGINSEVVVPANYNTPGQLVISGSVEGVNLAVENLKAAGAKLTVLLNVGGAFHSPLMEPARQELEAAIQNTKFHPPICPIYQNVNARPETDPAKIQQNLVAQLTAPVRWTQTIQQMVADGAKTFVETGPGTVLQKMVKKIERSAEALTAEASLVQ